MAYTVEMHGADLADHLAATLTDLEFELLVRKRVKAEIARAHAREPNLAESHDSVDFRFSGSDQSNWDVTLGETYSRYSTSKGEVLSVTINDVMDMQRAKSRNKMSLLLAAPEPVVMVASVSTQGRVDNIPF